MSRHVPRIHFSVDGLATLCATLPQAITDDRSSVTCRLCARRIEQVDARARAERDRRGDVAPAVLSGPGQSVVGAIGDRAIKRSIAGEPLDDRAPYSSDSAVFDAIAMTRDVPRSIASSSRMEPRGTGGGATPTTPREMHDRKTDLDKCWNCGIREMVIGDIVVPADVVGAILTLRLLGKQVAVPVVEKILGKEIDRRSHTMQRRPVEATDIAEAAGLTRHQVGMIVRRGREAIINEAVRKGLRPPRRVNFIDRQTDSEDDMAKVIGYDLDGWKEIAAHLGRSESWCRGQAARAEGPLPVSRLGRDVYAKKSEVSAWLEQQMRAA